MREKKGKIDYWLFFVVFVLCCIGMIMVLSASQYSAAYEFGDSYYYLKRQIFNIAVGFVAMFLAIKIDYRIYGKLCWPIFFIGVGLMLLVMFSSLGDTGGGSQRWIQLGPMRFQPSDVMKLSMLVLLCQQLAEPAGYFVGKTLPYLAVVGVSCCLVAINDLGTGIVMGGTATLLLIIGGMKLRYLAALFGLGAAGLAVMVLPPQYHYRLTRLTSFLDPWADYYGTGYQVVQSLLAIGSGGLMGVGLGEGGAKWFYLPERHTDFIFAILVEEGGLLAGLVLLLLFLAFTWRGLTIAMRVKDTFGRLMAAGLTLMITVQALVNIAIALGMMPVTGITLPFISYGGTSLVISLAAVGVLLNISKSAKMKK